ncbi:MAG: aldo/keto reductase [Bacillota bacterium]|nr:aldo/keto reductase [Bacillota bacterium]
MTEIKRNFGFGCMRLPMRDGKIDTEELTRMVGAFMENGFNYFDTAHPYHGGESEKALKTCLTSRYPKDSYIFTDKLSTHNFTKQEDIRPLFASQLAACGVEYFDYYLMHAQSADLFAKFKRCRAYETALEFLAEGRIKHFGISFHDKAAVLEQILTEYPQIEVVQIQFNYLDYDDPAVESRKCYEVCRKYGKPVIVMEPCKGGNLVKLPPNISTVLEKLRGGSNASYAMRFAAGFPGVMMVLSGMGSMEMMLDNISYMKDFQPLDETEQAAVKKVCELFRAQNMISCTACRYCTDGCPERILIPDLFACMNAKRTFNDWNADYYYGSVHTVNNGKASDCSKCGKCEESCPQHLPIRRLLEDVAKEFERR